MQFAMVPLNLMHKNGKADFLNTGAWSKKAIAEARRFGKVNVLASSEDKVFSYIPDISAIQPDPEADYFHITTTLAPQIEPLLGETDCSVLVLR